MFPKLTGQLKNGASEFYKLSFTIPASLCDISFALIFYIDIIFVFSLS
jgi:hypothetical protein